MTITGNVQIDLSKVPKFEMDSLCRTINRAMEAFYEDPKNVAEFEAWLASYKARKGVA